MSFTASVKDELSHINATCPHCDYALLSGIVRICGSLSLKGSTTSHSRYSVTIATEAGVVARMIINLTHTLFDLDTYLTVRHSNLHKTRNYVIQIPYQDSLPTFLHTLEILDATGALCTGIPQKLLQRTCCAQAFLRGCFIAGGFMSDPRTSFHMEISVSSAAFAREIVALADTFGIVIRSNQRRSTISLYIKKFDSILLFLQVVGAKRLSRAFENIRKVKRLKNEVNRRVNAEMANQTRSCMAATDQLLLIEKVQARYAPDDLPRALRQFCEVRQAHPELSLAALGELVSPQASKSAMYHRVLRLQKLVDTLE